MRLGIGVTEPIRRHPMILAQAALTLAHMSQRPPILGLGSGERLGAEPCGLDFSRNVGRLEEALPEALPRRTSRSSQFVHDSHPGDR